MSLPLWWPEAATSKPLRSSLPFTSHGASHPIPGFLLQKWLLALFSSPFPCLHLPLGPRVSLLGLCPMRGCSSAQPPPPLLSSPEVSFLRSKWDLASEPLQIEGDGRPSAYPVCPACSILSFLRNPLSSMPDFSIHQTGVGPFYWSLKKLGLFPVVSYFSMVEGEKFNNVLCIVWMPVRCSRNCPGTLLPQHCLWRCGAWSSQRTMTVAPADAWASVVACTCCCLFHLLKWEAAPASLRWPHCGMLFVTLGGSALLSGVLGAHRLGLQMQTNGVHRPCCAQCSRQCAQGNRRVKRGVGSDQEEDRRHSKRHRVGACVHPVVLKEKWLFLCAFLIHKEEVKNFNY